MPLKADLDAIDWKILRELQDDGRMTNVELSRRVGISAPPCLRRVKRLEEAGIIRGYRALLNAPALGMDVVAFCLVGLHHQSDAELQDLRRADPRLADRARRLDGVGRIRLPAALRGQRPDHLPDLRHRELTSTPNVDTVRTALTIRQVKDEGLVAI